MSAELGNRIKRRREALEISQENLAELLGVTQVQLSRYERGGSNPNVEKIVRMAQILKTSTDWLLGLVDDDGNAIEQSVPLSPLEEKMIEYFRTKPRNRQHNIVELVRMY